MTNNYPQWSTKKQKEGMKLFNDIADAHGHFEVEFTQHEWTAELNLHAFYAVVRWSSHGLKDLGLREHTFPIAWDYEPTYSHTGELVHHWQLVIANGDATRELSLEVFYLDLFFALDKIANTHEAV